MDTLLGIKDVLGILDISRTKLHRLRCEENFPNPKMVGRSPRWKARQIDAWFENREGK